MSATITCNQFRPNFWRPTICSYCCRPKGIHDKFSSKTTLGGLTRIPTADWLNTDGDDDTDSSEYFFIPPRANTISTASPSSLRERRQNSEPLIKDRASHSYGDFNCSSSTLRTQRTQVGIVKPYAVVNLHDTWAAAAVDSQYWMQTPASTMTNKDLSSPFLRQRSGSCNALMLQRVSSSTSSSLQSAPAASNQSPLLVNSSSNTLPSVEHHQKRHIIPKRKAPPPPNTITYRNIPRPRLLQSKRASSVPSLLITDEMLEDMMILPPATPSRDTNTSASTTDLIGTRKKELVPPNKPPRTQSTFVIQDEEETSISLSSPTTTTSTEIVQKQVASDYEPLRRPGGRLSHDTTKLDVSLLQQLHDMFTDALTNISERAFDQLTCNDHIKSLDWNDITVCIDLNNHHQLYYHMEPITVEPLDYDKHGTELEMVKSLAPHINLALLRGTLKQAPIDYADFLPDANNYIVRDSPSNKVPLDTLLTKWHKALSEEDYCQSILLVLVQVLQGLKYLFNNGIVHRDVGLESLIAWTTNIGVIVKLRNFSYALHRPGPLSVTTFVFAYHELSWLGGVESHLPPEIVDTPPNANTLDYAHTDSFAVGCLIYELTTGLSPFDKDPQLVYSDYTSDDLPKFVPDYSEHHPLQYLQKLAHLLLTRDPLKRLGLGDALLLTQSMLWLPHSWLEHSIPKHTIEEHLIYLKGSLVAELAQQDTKTGPSLENLLKADFLATCNTVELLRALSVMTQVNVYGTYTSSSTSKQ